MRASYGVTFVILISDWFSATVIAVSYVISLSIRPCYNGTLLYNEKWTPLLGNFWGSWQSYCQLPLLLYIEIYWMGDNRTRQIWGIWKLRPAYSPETPNLGQNQWCFVPCDLEMWWMTLENNRASFLCCFKRCATFHSHRWIQPGVTVWKRPIWVKFEDF